MTGQVAGTPGYMPPEQQDDLKLAEKPADVWALGSTLFTLLAGRSAFPGGQAAIISQVARDEFPALPADVDAPIVVTEILAKATRRRPEDRYRDAAEMAAALEEAQRQIGRGPASPGVATAAAPRGAAPEPQPLPKPSRLVIPGFKFLARNPQGYDEYEHEKTALVFVLLPGGKFRMGSPESEPERSAAEGPVHKVELSPFLIAKLEVTQEVWAKVMRSKPSHSKGEKGLPADSVSSDEGKAFCERTGLEFPTEAQWEYAARGGTETPFSFGETITTDHANYDGRYPYGKAPKGLYRKKTVPVGSLPANPFGLHEVHGNLWEWCFDVFDAEFYKNPEARRKDPRCESGSEFRVLRGGSWLHYARRCRSAYRVWDAPGFRWDFVGFRPAFSRLATE